MVDAGLTPQEWLDRVNEVREHNVHEHDTGSLTLHERLRRMEDDIRDLKIESMGIRLEQKGMMVKMTVVYSIVMIVVSIAIHLLFQK